MGVIVGYLIVALFFLALATGWYRPKRWRELSDRTISILRFGCFLGFLVIALKLAGRLL